MIERYLRTFNIKILFFILSNLLSIRDLVDTQQLIFPRKDYTKRFILIQRDYNLLLTHKTDNRFFDKYPSI